MTAGAKAQIGGGSGSGGAPSGPAGGDLTGTYPNPAVGQIQGVAVDSSAPSTNDFFTYNGTQWSHARIFSGAAAVTTNTTAANGNVVACDTTSGAITVTMPATPANGAHVAVVFRTGSNAVTVAANTGQFINGSLANILLTNAGQSVELWYSAVSTTWNIISGLSVPPSSTGFTASGDLTGNYPAPTLATFPYLFAYASGSTTITSGSNANLPYDTVTTTLGTNAPTVAAGVVTINRKGIYRITMLTSTNASASTLFTSAVINGSTSWPINYVVNNSVLGARINGGLELSLAVGNTISINVTSFSAATTIGGGATNAIIITYLGPN